MNGERYYSAAQSRELDRLASAEFGIPSFTLMQRAGAAAFAALRRRWPRVRRLEICAGTGNNGGDGFIIGALAVEAGLQARIHLLGELARVQGTALEALDLARARQVPVEAGITLSPDANTVVVDALLGTGLVGALRSPYREAIAAINASALPVLAVDSPSGLDSDSGAILGDCVRADITVTFIARKLGLARGEGPRMCGEVIFDSLDVPDALYGRLP
ncbi:MAG: NAD(P)H-hydrate epimerase [Pseudomonadales bacterium]|jgi:NAD(P)H-hydrate epimerase|nr:NAD(P)H-hydrate epimerase [Pseudomonadales bacterium]